MYTRSSFDTHYIVQFEQLQQRQVVIINSKARSLRSERAQSTTRPPRTPKLGDRALGIYDVFNAATQNGSAERKDTHEYLQPFAHAHIGRATQSHRFRMRTREMRELYVLCTRI